MKKNYNNLSYLKTISSDRVGYCPLSEGGGEMTELRMVDDWIPGWAGTRHAGN